MLFLLEQRISLGLRGWRETVSLFLFDPGGRFAPQLFQPEFPSIFAGERGRRRGVSYALGRKKIGPLQRSRWAVSLCTFFRFLFLCFSPLVASGRYPLCFPRKIDRKIGQTQWNSTKNNCQDWPSLVFGVKFQWNSMNSNREDCRPIYEFTVHQWDVFGLISTTSF